MADTQTEPDSATPAKPPSSPGGTFTDMLRQEQAQRAGVLGEMKAQTGAITSAIQEGKKERTALGKPFNLSPEEYERLFKPPPVQYNNPYEGSGALAAQLAVLGSAFTRRPLINTLNTAAAALNAVRAGDAEATKAKMEEWKANRDLALKIMDFQHAAYKEQLEAIKEGTAEEIRGAEANLRVLTSQFDHPFLREAIDAGRFEMELAREERQKEQWRDVSGELHAKAGPVVRLSKIAEERAAAVAAGDAAKVSQLDQEAVQQTRLIHQQKGGAEGGTGIEADLLKEWTTEFQQKQGRLPTAQEKTDQYAKMHGEVHPSMSQALAGMKRENAADDIAYMQQMIEEVKPLISVWTTGIPGDVNEAVQSVLDRLGMPTDTKPAEVKQSIALIQSKLRNEILNSKWMSKGAIKQADEIVQGLEAWDGPTATKKTLEKLQGFLEGEKGRLHSPPGSSRSSPHTAPAAGGGVIKYDAEGNRISAPSGAP